MENYEFGKKLAVNTISGTADNIVPVALFTWGFEYTWKFLEIQPWQMACGSTNTWHNAFISMYHKHNPDILLYSNTGSGDNEPTLIRETEKSWFIRDENTGEEYELIKATH